MRGYELAADVDEQERVILTLADNKMEREEFTEWVKAHVVPFQAELRP